jgi:hypothetical protein
VLDDPEEFACMVIIFKFSSELFCQCFSKIHLLLTKDPK